MNKQERDALKRLEKITERRINIMLTLTETLAKVCESDIQALEAIRILARQPEGVEHEPTPKIEPEPEEYDGYIQYTDHIDAEAEKNRMAKKHGCIETVPFDPDDDDWSETPDEAEERAEYERRIQEWGWIG